MIDSLPINPTPEWLQNACKENNNDYFPLQDILRNSLYYPASFFDGFPIKHLSGNFHSFADRHGERSEGD